MTATDRERRQQILAQAKSVVVKVGTNVLSTADDRLDVDRIRSLAEQLHEIVSSGRKVVLVSSGAIGSGLSLLHLKKRPDLIKYRNFAV